MRQKTSLYLAAIVMLALALRLPRFLAAQVVLTEGTTYATIARNLAAGDGYVGILGMWDFFVPPLYPLLMSFLVRLGLDVLWAGRLISLALGALLPLPVYWLTRQVSGRRLAGLLAGLLIAGHPLLITYTSRVWSETLYSFLVWCGLCCSWLALTTSSPRLCGAAALAGLCFGSAYLTRHEGAVYFVVFLALLAAVWVRQRLRTPVGAAWARAGADAGARAKTRLVDLLLPLVAAIAAFALLAVPYITWLSGQAGRVIWETKSVPNFVTAQRLATGMDYMEAAYGLTATGEPAGPFLYRNELISRPPADVAPSLLDSLTGMLQGLQDEAKFYLVDIASPLVMVLVLAGLLGGHWEVDRLRQGGFLLLFSAALLFLLPGVTKPLALLPLLAASWIAWNRRALAGVGFLLAFLLPAVAVVSLVPRVDTRYLTPMTGYVALWVGTALAAGHRWARRAWASRPRWGDALLVLLLLFCLAVLLHSIRGGVLAVRAPRVVLDLDQRQAGEWLASVDPSPDKRIMSVHSQIPFYAGGVHVPMPYASPDLVQAYAQAREVDYVVVSPRKLASRPPLELWTHGEQLPVDWEPVYRDGETGLVMYAAR